MIDVTQERPVPLSAVHKLPVFPEGREPHLSTVYRWVGGFRGEKLETLQIGGVTCTSCEALIRFFARLSGEPTSAHAPTAKQLERRAARADRELARAGI